MSAAAEEHGPSGAEAADLRRQLEELRQAFEDYREAQTPAQRQEARQDVADIQEDLEGIAKRTGMSREHLERAISEARKAERREEMRPIVQEILREEREAAEEAARVAAEAAGEETPPKPPKAKPPKAPAGEEEPPAADDTPPIAQHWSDRSVGGLFGGRK